VDGVIEELKEKYPDGSVSEYLEEVRHHILDNLDPFKNVKGSPKSLRIFPRAVRRKRLGRSGIRSAFTG